MTGAERMRRLRERAAAARGDGKRDEKPHDGKCDEKVVAAPDEKLRTENDALKAKIDEMTKRLQERQELAAKAAKPCDEKSDEELRAKLAELRADYAELEKTLDGPTSDLWKRMKEIAAHGRLLQRNAKKEARAEVQGELAALRGEIERVKSDPERASAKEIAELTKQLKAAKTRIDTLRSDVRHYARKSSLVLSKAERNTFLKALHPDGANEKNIEALREALTKASRLFNVMHDEKRILIEGEPTREENHA
jgi:hypothetical protein